MKYKIVTDVSHVADGLIRSAADARDPLTFMAVCVIGGERAWQCDEAIAALDGDVVVGLVTIAPKGESGADMPELVGLFVIEKYRRTGVGRELLIRAITGCRERDLIPLRLSLLSKAASKLVKNLPPDMLVDLQVDDKSDLLPF